MPYFFTVLALLALLLGGTLSWVSRQEREVVATRRSLLLGGGLFLGLMGVGWAPWSGIIFLQIAVLAATLAGTVYLFWPTPAPEELSRSGAVPRVDERTVMFSRAELEPGTARWEDYYAQYPEHRELDDRFRRLPGLMSPRSGKYAPLSFAAAAASFKTVDCLVGLINGESARETVPLDPGEATLFLKQWARKLGALEAGVTAMRPEHFYAVKGRGENYGQLVRVDHAFGLAFTVEMDHHHLGTAPEGPTLMESAQQYLNAGAIAVQLAEFIRQLGYQAEAHIDGNYRVVCPLVARDAGLGEMGRMGLLMTPRLGPRVRLGVVTTDLPLLADPIFSDTTVLDFCALCRKCADICPARAIPQGTPETVDGVTRWQIDQAACFTYWCAVGTDCGQCMKVCPYAHPDSWIHNVVRKGLARSGRFRRFALAMDDLLYGRQPDLSPLPHWIPGRVK